MTSTIGGFKDRKIESRAKVEPVTVQPNTKYKTSLDTIAQIGYQLIANDSVDSATTSIITAAAHLALAGDVVQFTSGTLNKEFVHVTSVDTNTITLAQTLSAAPSPGDTFVILRPTILRLDASGGIIIAPGSAGYYAEDSQHTSGDIGNFILGVRRDADTSPVDADNDYHAAIFDNLGNLKVYAKNPSIEKTDDQAPSNNLGLVVGGVYIATPTTITDGDYGRFLIDSQRRLQTATQGELAHDAIDTGNPLKIGGKASSSIPTAVATGDRVNAYFDVNGRQATFINGANGTASVERAATFDTNSIAATNIGLTANSRNHQIWSSTHVDAGGGDNNFYAQNMDANGNLCSNLSSIRGTLLRAINGTGVATTHLPIGSLGRSSAPSAVTSGRMQELYLDLNGRPCIWTDQGLGNVAHDGIDSGNPLKIGFKAVAHGANPTAVAAADRTDAYANRHGVQFVIGGHPNVVTIRANYTAAQTDTAIVTISTGLKIVVTRCSVTCDNANTVDVAARIGFGTANTPTTTGVILSHPGIAPGSGVIEGSGGGMLGVGADNEDLRITSEVPTSGSIDVVVSYYTIES